MGWQNDSLAHTKGVTVIDNLIQIGEPVEHRGIVIAPLFPTRDPVAAYVTLDEALAQGLRISEVDEAGTVPELVVENPLDKRVLLYDGEELVGAKQNRILNVSVLVEAKSTLRIPVSCVEQGRWSRRSRSFLPGSHVSHAQLRRRKLEAQAAQPLARGVAQSEVWDAVHEKAMQHERLVADRCELGSLSRTTSATFELSRTPSRSQPGQCGAVLGLGADLCLDVVSRPDAFARLWPKLRAGYLLDALERLDGKATLRGTVDEFVAAVGRSDATRQPSVGLGEDIRLRTENAIGSGLELDGEVIQLSAFRSEDGGRRAFGRIARPSRRQ